MYEIRFNLTSSVVHTSEESFRAEYVSDFPNWIHFITEQTITKASTYGINRRDLEWHPELNSMQTIMLFNTLEGGLDYIRTIYNDVYDMDVSKTLYNDVQFKQYTLNTDITILDGKYTASVLSITEVGI